MSMHYKACEGGRTFQVAMTGKQQARAREAAMLADAALPVADPVPTVTYASHGSTLVIGDAVQAIPLAEQLAGHLPVTVLLPPGSGYRGISPSSGFAIVLADIMSVSGWLGAFTASWQAGNRNDGDDLAVPSHGRFDLVLDLSTPPAIGLHQPPPGYFAPGSDISAQARAVAELTDMVGDFEKPKYFTYKERLCAHSRNQKVGCNACIDICSAKAIDHAGDRIRVNPHLCAGCGACTTVCPSGALAYAYPAAPHSGMRMRTVLNTYLEAGGKQPALLLHSQKRGSELVREHGLPARLIPLELHHTASVGIDLWLAAVAYGATGVAVLTTDEEAPQYVDALAEQMAIAQTILSGLGYPGRHFQLIRAATSEQLTTALRQLPAGQAPEKRATFHVAAEKRNALDFVLDHLYRHAPTKPEHIGLLPGAPFGAVEVNTATCTLCMSCAGACPASALMDSNNTPQLRFVEKNCVQCGLCVQTCPEQAITLAPRISFTEAAKKPVVLNETQPFFCIRCNKPFGTLQMIESMMARLAHHAAFSGNPDRLKMCGDCRVVDMMESRRETSIVELKRR